MKKKMAKKAARRIVRITPTAAKTKLLMTKVRDLENRLKGSFSRTQLQSVTARYRIAMARFHSERNRVKLLQTRVRNLERRIDELQRDLAGKSA